MIKSDKEFKEKISGMADDELIELAHQLHIQLRKARKHKDSPEKTFITDKLQSIHSEQLFRTQPHLRNVINRITKKNAIVLGSDKNESIAKENTQHQSENEPEWYRPGMDCDWIDGIPQKPATTKEIINQFKTDPNVIVRRME